MNKNVYEKTRYQNIYRHKKNKNYVVMISKPVKTSISKVNGNKIYKIEEAIDIRDNKKLQFQKGIEVKNKEDFDSLLDKYEAYCKNDLNLSFNTLKKKRNLYKLYFRGRFDKISKVTKQDMLNLLNNANCSDKQKNELIKIIKPFFNWCVEEDIIFKSPMVGIKLYKVNKQEMKYWLPEHVTRVLDAINEDLDNDNVVKKYHAYLIKMVVEIGLSLGDRIGETRAIQFCNVSEEYSTITIKHSINYNTKDSNYLAPTKTRNSEEKLYVTQKLINDIDDYRIFLINELKYEVRGDTPILVNVATDRPYSDSKLRELFNYYIDKAQVPKIRMYDLRHTVATLLMTDGYDMYDIKDRLRHASIKTTIDKYGHIIEEKRKEIAEATAKYI